MDLSEGDMDLSEGGQKGVVWPNMFLVTHTDPCHPQVLCRGSVNHSGALESHASGWVFWHNNMKTTTLGPPVPCSSIVLVVYLDHSVGTLTLLHKVQTSFTEPLYPGCFIWDVSEDADNQTVKNFDKNTNMHV